MCECQEKLPSFLFTTNIIPPDRVQIFDTFLFSGGAFRSSAGCLRPNISLLFLPLFFLPSFLLFTTSMMIFGFESGKRPPFLLSSNTFFVQNYSQQAHASCLKGIPTR